jgi:class 3 adenylate cyclase
MGRPSHGHATAHGDAVTLAFRLASTAGRASVPPILASVEATDDPAEAARYGQPFEIAIKGHTRPARVRSVSGISGGGNGRA